MADPYAWPDPGDLHARLCASQAEVSRLRTELAHATAERDAATVALDTLLTGLCHAAIHDGRLGRVGEPSLWRAVLKA